MKSITETIGGAQQLLDVPFDLQTCFEEQLTDEYTTCMQLLRVIKEYTSTLIRAKAKTGRTPYTYEPFVFSELAKRFFGIEKTSSLIQRLKGEPNLRLLCGFDKVPGKATFSRMFSYLAQIKTMDAIHEQLVRLAYKDTRVYHVCRDSTAIPARETVPKKTGEKREKPKKKRGRPAKNTPKEPAQPTVLETQVIQDAQTSLDMIDTKCAWGLKKNSQGHVHVWKGYKLHLDTSDTGFPLTACVTGANVHDSQLAIPMEKLTEQKVQFCYSLMDAGYDAKTINEFIASRGRVPIIDHNKRKNDNRPPFDPAKEERYKIRTTVERAYSHLKDSFIPKAMYVKGYTKVSYVLMSAVVCLATLNYLHHFLC